ncbi:MAG: hypothetical protein AAGF13_08385 [Pseudomonadota bacterium]
MALLGTASEATGPAKTRLEELRRVILAAADVPLKEDTRWGQHSFLPPAASGTAVRLHWTKDTPERVEMLVHCGTDLVAQWRDIYDGMFAFDGKRALHLSAEGKLDTAAVAHMAAMAFTYTARATAL